MAKLTDHTVTWTVLSVSTSHITKHTEDMLQSGLTKNIGTFNSCIIEYGSRKLEYVPGFIQKQGDGWTLLDILAVDVISLRLFGLPDLATIIKLANDNHYAYIYIDPDAETIDELPTYDW